MASVPHVPRGSGDGFDSRGFDFSAAMERLMRDAVARVATLRHIDIDRVGIGIIQARNASRYGVYAQTTPLRFAGGATQTRRRGRLWTLPRYPGARGDLLYLIGFVLPRYLDQPLEEKLATAIHELWHISPAFDGDIRRYPGRRHAHGRSRAGFHDEARRLRDRWLAADPPAELYDFLRMGFRELEAARGPIYGIRYRVPRLILAKASGT